MGMFCSFLHRHLLLSTRSLTSLSRFQLGYSPAAIRLSYSTLVMAKRKRTQPQEELEPSVIPSTPTRPKRTTKSPRKKAVDDSWDPYGGATAAGVEADDPGSLLTDLDDEFSPTKGKKGGAKRTRKKKSDEPVVYTEKEIPPVEKKVTQFRGTRHIQDGLKDYAV